MSSEVLSVATNVLSLAGAPRVLQWPSEMKEPIAKFILQGAKFVTKIAIEYAIASVQWPGPTPDGIRCYLYLLVTSLASPKKHYQMTEEHDVLLHRNKKQPMIRKQKSKHCQYKCDYFRLIYPRCTGIKLVYSWWRVKQDRWRVNRNLANNTFVYCPQFRILLWICLTIFVLFHL